MTLIALGCPTVTASRLSTGVNTPWATALFVPEYRVRYGEFSSGLP
jgi:hypothetical protein